MSAKSANHDAAQKKVWRAELQQHERALHKVNKDFEAEQRLRNKALRDAQKALAKEERNFARFIARRAKVLPATVKDLETRMAVLRGRIEA